MKNAMLTVITGSENTYSNEDQVDMLINLAKERTRTQQRSLENRHNSHRDKARAGRLKVINTAKPKVEKPVKRKQYSLSLITAPDVVIDKLPVRMSLKKAC